MTNLGNRAAAAVDLSKHGRLLGLAVPTSAFRADDLDVGHHEAPSGLQKETPAFSPLNLLFGSHSELRAVAEVYRASDGQSQMVQDFARAWTKVMAKERDGR